MAEFNHVMIDIETLDTTLHSVIISIAAVKFNFNDDKTETFYRNIHPKTCSELGMTISQETVNWWADQSTDARKAVTINQVHIHDALEDMVEFLSDLPKHTEYWAQGIVFDYGNLQNALELCDIQDPWLYHKISDSRTLFKFCHLDWTSYPRVGSHHNALDDCLTQIAALKEIFGNEE